jgi:hypothetical protein
MSRIVRLSHAPLYAIVTTLLWTVAASAQPQWSISPPIVREGKPANDDASKRATPTPLLKKEAREKEEFARLTIERIFVEGPADDANRQRREKEQRFANTLNRGNPEVPGGKIRRGAYYDGFVYWGGDPLSFLWLNTFNRLRE